MKIKRIVGAAVLIAGLVLLLAIASFLSVPRDNTAAAGMEETRANGILGEKENSIDILVIGDSEAYSSISPLQLWEEKGYTAYVCGTASQRLSYSNILLRRAFQTQKPKIVILETLAIYRKMSPGNVALTEIARLFPIFQYHDRWKSYDLKGLDSGIKYNWTDDYKGYFYSNQVTPAHKTEYMTPTDASSKIAKANRKYIQKIKEFCDENGAELILLSTPSPQNWDYESHNGIESLASELGCEYIDLNLMNDVIKIDWSQDTRDGGDHLNFTGATKVTHYLAEYLSGKGVLSDHRGDERYAHWNECLAKLNAEAKGTSDKGSDETAEKPK
ncbi:MAG: hypothetical protein VB112_04455 [Oscillospiraceae bacterium]|nr:hypothetical protein [Oscillospiraceae bacterium]